jgi:tetratricopeptide (TPR) repeat protein
MRWLPTEYLLKGVFLGLVAFAALQQSTPAPDGTLPGSWRALAQFNLLILGGLVVALVIGAVAKMREGYRASGRFLLFLLFLLLETPTLVYAGILGGTVAGVVLILPPQNADLLVWCVLGGAGLGLGLGLMRHIQRRSLRLSFILLAAAALATLFLIWFHDPFSWFHGGRSTEKDDATYLFAAQVLLGIPFFYILTFAGVEEETEVETGAMAASFAIGVGLLTVHSPQFRFIGLVLPAAWYVWYTIFILPGLRVLKHAFRGLSYAEVGRHRGALVAFRRALQLDPEHVLAREGFWNVHCALDLKQLANDPETLALVDFDLCLERVASLLVRGTPTPDQMEESRRLLELVLSQRPAMRPQVGYWRAVAHTHVHEFDQAVAELHHLLDPDYYGANNPNRLAVLAPAWLLALVLHPELRRRLGETELARPGRRMEAIAGVEKHLAANAGDSGMEELKRQLYHDLTEAEYEAELSAPSASEGAAAHPARALGAGRSFDHGYVERLGMSLIQDAEHWKRGAEYLRLAARGQPARAVSIYVQIAKAHLRANDDAGAVPYFEQARDAARAVGVKNLADSEQRTYFATVKYLGEAGLFRGNVDSAIENLRLYTESPDSGLETYRALAEAYERKQEPLLALRACEQALLYNSKDPDLVERKHKYYFSVMPEVLHANLDMIRPAFDVPYCTERARTILENPAFTDLEWLEVADHLVKLALVMQPENLSAEVLLARVQLRQGDRDSAIALLEKVREPKPEKFATSEDEESWYVCCQVLGDLYMEISRADLAVPCYLDFRKSIRSGAKTLYKLGQAYEQLGDVPRAIKCYQLVTGYEGNPLVYDARGALSRLGAS